MILFSSSISSTGKAREAAIVTHVQFNALTGVMEASGMQICNIVLVKQSLKKTIQVITVKLDKVKNEIIFILCLHVRTGTYLMHIVSGLVASFFKNL